MAFPNSKFKAPNVLFETFDGTGTPSITSAPANSVRSVNIIARPPIANFYGFIIEPPTTTAAPTTTAPPVYIGDPYYNSVTLLAQFQGNDYEQIFIDSSPNNLTLAPVGNAITSIAERTGTAYTSLYSTASSAVLIDNLNALEFAGDFTIEAWTYSMTGNGGTVISLDFANPGGFSLYISGTQYSFNTGVVSMSSAPNLATNNARKWVHLAVSRIGNEMRLFVNGIAQEMTFTTDIIGGTGGVAHISHPTSSWYGYIQDVRVTNGICRYTSDFTPPSTLYPPYYDTTNPPYYPPPIISVPTVAETVFLLNFNNDYVDAMGHTFLATGESYAIDTQGYNDTTIVFSGSTAVYTPSTVPDLNVVASDFTIELWMNPSQLSNSTIFSTNKDNRGTPAYKLALSTDGILRCYVSRGAAFSEFINYPTPLQVGQWYHVALVRYGQAFHIFVNGQRTVGMHDSLDLGSTGANFVIGADFWPSPGGGSFGPSTQFYNGFVGSIGSFRFANNRALYMYDFTPDIYKFMPPKDPPVATLMPVPSTNVSVLSTGTIIDNVAWFSINITSTKVVTIDTLQTPGDLDTAIGVYDSAGSLVAYNDDYDPIFLSSLTHTFIPGTYYVCVSFYELMCDPGFYVTTDSILDTDIILNIS